MMAIGFLGYVLPMGQMSLWGATVITNLLSAIPVFGQDLVELIWKLKKAFYKKLNLYYAYLEQSKSKLKKFIYLKTYLPWYANFPKRALEWAKVALNSKLTLFKKETQKEFPVIGEINWKKVRKEKPLTELDIKFLLSIPFAFLAQLAGIILFSISLISAVGIYLDKGNKVKDSTQDSSKELVTWGSNLASGVSNKRMTSELSKMYDNIPYPVISIIHGLLLSDAWLTFSSKASKKARLGFSQSLAKFAYLWSVFNSLSPYCGSYPMLRIRTRKGSKTVSLDFLLDLYLFLQIYTQSIMFPYLKV